MKPAVMRKTAQVTAVMLIISILLPVLAFAATSGFVTDPKPVYKNGRVTGSVYSDVYADVYSQVYFYSPDGSQVSTTQAVYSSVYNGVYTYTFDRDAIGSGYPYLRMKFEPLMNGAVYASVYETVYRTPTDSGNGGSGGGGGGGGGWSASESISVNSDGSVNADQLDKSLNQYDEVTLTLSGDAALLPAKALKNYTGNTKKLLKIKNSNGQYNLPLSVLKLDDLAGKVSTTVDDLIVKVSIAKASQSISDSVYAAAQALGGSVASNIIDFNIVGLGKDNKTAALDLGNNYLSRILPTNKSVDASKATAILYNETTKKLSFVPAIFSSSDATIKRNGSSVYAVIEMNKSFTDISGHWAEGYIKLLANKLVVDGATDTLFQPERGITRAEFAALVVRSLGLDTSSTSTSFKDVSSSDWFAGVVGAAVNAKIIDGYEDNTFKPNNQINREELAAMVVRALNYAGAAPAANGTSSLAKFKDANSIVWAKNEIAVAVDAGIIDGMTNDTIGPRQTATRAQSATMLKRLLVKANFINE
ncbi:S-layer homology domain-containing protein [Paenibacillus filicis]|uniref:S-layer homology domain-containing protein n=1 Tax=Paenibacillus gyeongsangnamensis TaxID=3388067 RepID=A0ABT4QKX1_9BACL|nr:S-layer homology domain-containing protein [Paenibacillus filicis]MCZ8517503.1 S-layer homology domain-containing protein [Paenibacillus filicis]